MIRETKISVQRTAHYYSFGQAGLHIKNFWIVCHGYGQAAEKMLYKFDKLNPDNTLVIAPEGLSKFYWQGFSGDPVASWMTKLHREDEIEDYCNYLQQIYQETIVQLPKDVSINVMGFSQGCATVMRWLCFRNPTFDRLILWAGQLPDDIDYAKHAPVFEDKKIQFIYGDQDQFLTEERISKYKAYFKTLPFDIETISFKGKHEVNRTLLEKIATFES